MFDYIKSSLFGIVALVLLTSPFLISRSINKPMPAETLSFQNLNCGSLYKLPAESKLQSDSIEQTSAKTILKGMGKEPLLGPI